MAAARAAPAAESHSRSRERETDTLLCHQRRELGEAVDQQPCSRQQKRRERHLAGNQRAAESGGEAARRRACLLHGLVRIAPRRDERRGESEQQHGRRYQGEGEHEHGNIHGGIADARRFGRRKSHQHAHAKPRQRDSDGARNAGQCRRFAEEHAEQSPAARAEGRADRDLAPPPGSPRQQPPRGRPGTTAASRHPGTRP
jgi:hypothetical protein